MSTRTNRQQASEQTPTPGGPNQEQPTPQDEQATTPGQEQERERQTFPPLHEHPDFNARIEQARRSGVRELLTALGFDNLDTPDAVAQAQQDLADLVAFAREQRQAQMSAEERIQAQIEEAQRRLQAAEQRAQAAEQRAQEVERQRNDYVRRTEVIAEASRQGARYPDDVWGWALVNSQDDLEPIINEDGSVNREAVKRIVEAHAAARPELYRGNTPGSPSNAGARPTEAIRDVERRLELARQTARRGMR